MPFAAFRCDWAAPAIARWISLPPPPRDREAAVMASEVQALRLVARRTWRFFETFVTAEEHCLPPDNFQETPQPVVAHRTSPTNMGLYLLSTVAARDLGWLGTLEAAERLEATIRNDGRAWSSSAGISITGMTRVTCGPCAPNTFRPWTAATSPDIFWWWITAAARLIQRSSLDVKHFRWGAMMLLRNCARRWRRSATPGARTRSRASSLTTPWLLWPLSLEQAPADRVRMGGATRWSCGSARKPLADIAQTLAQELDLGRDSDLRSWADAVRGSVESHFRDAEILLPWLRLDPAAVTRLTETSCRAGS